MICISPIAPFGETARGSPPLSVRITAQIQLAGILNLCEASATKAVNGRAVRGLAVPAIEAVSACAEPSNGAPEQKKSEAAQIIAWTNGERAGAFASPVVGNKTVWIGCRRGAMACGTAAQDPAEITEWPPLLSPGVIEADSRDGGTITPPLRFD
jgi:hypothetical protein